MSGHLIFVNPACTYLIKLHFPDKRKNIIIKTLNKDINISSIVKCTFSQFYTLKLGAYVHRWCLTIMIATILFLHDTQENGASITSSIG